VDLLTVFLIALALAMDAFAVSISCGITMKELRVRSALRIALAFGSFQAFMPVIGYMAGMGVRRFLQDYDHWVAFCLLGFIGSKMIYESFFLDEDRKSTDADHLPTLLTLSVATSIDALAVGISLSLIAVDIIYPALVIGMVTFAVSYAGAVLGTRVGHLFERKMEVAGGLILIAIGCRILYEHLGHHAVIF
jgi:putative Mn2+ efflux pump MntP